MKKSKAFNKKIIIAISIIAMIITASVTYAVWSIITGNNNDGGGNIDIGEGKTATTEVNLSNFSSTGGILVPEGFANSQDEVDEIEFTFYVRWNAVQDVDGIVTGAAGELTITATSIVNDSGDDLLNDKADVGALFNITFNLPEGQSYYDIEGEGDAVEVVVTITLTEPETQEQYETIAGSNITITFEFAVEPVVDA